MTNIINHHPNYFTNLHLTLWFQVANNNSKETIIASRNYSLNKQFTVTFQIFQSNPNNMHTAVWFQDFLSNTNNLHMVVWFQEFLPYINNHFAFSNYFYLIIVLCLHRHMISSILI